MKLNASTPSFLTYMVIAISAIVLAACSTVSTAPSEQLAAKIQNAKTPADHEELARIYERDAEEALGQIKIHRLMARNYTSMFGGRGAVSAMPSHCESIAQKYAAIAEEKKALAKLHRDLAANPPASK